MLKKVRVTVKVHDSELTVTCGDGKQTFKWLALVIQTKIKDDSNLRKRFDVNSFIVSEIRNIFGELLNPNDLIEEHAGPSGLSVSAILSSKFPLDQWENPQLGAWYKSAYVKSDVGKYWNSELDAWRSSVKEIDDTSKQNEEKKRTHFIQVGFDFSADDVNTAFEFDAKNMKWDWITGDTNISRMMDVLRVNYLLICNIFAHYCGVGQVGERYGLSLWEFGHFLHFQKLFNFKTDMDVIEEIYYSSGGKGRGLGTATGASAVSDTKHLQLMTRAHFCEGLAKAATYSQPQGTAPAAALEALLTRPVNIFWRDITSSYLLYTSKDVMVKSITLQYYQILKQAFNLKATHDSKGSRLGQEDFLDLMRASGLIEEGPLHETASTNSFRKAQLYADDASWSLNDLVFCEFIEAVSRLSLEAIENSSGLNAMQKIRMGFDSMTSLQTNLKISRK